LGLFFFSHSLSFTTSWPKLQSGAGGTGESTFEERKVMGGRLVCDTYMAAKDLIRQTSYSLVNLAKTQLGITHEAVGTLSSLLFQS